MGTMATNLMNGSGTEGAHAAVSSRRRRAAPAKIAPAPSRWWDIVPARDVFYLFLGLLAFLYSSGWISGVAKQNDVSDLGIQIQALSARFDTHAKEMSNRFDGLSIKVDDYREQVVRLVTRDEMRTQAGSASPVSRLATRRLPAGRDSGKTDKPKSFLGNILGQ
jgi:hypothetical protein